MVEKNMTRESIRNVIKAYIFNNVKCKKKFIDDLTPETNVCSEAGFDWFDEIELIVHLEKYYNIKIGWGNELPTIEDYVNIVMKRVNPMNNIVMNSVKRECVKEVKKPIAQKNRGIILWFSNKIQQKKQEKADKIAKKETEKADKEYNEMVVLQDILFETAVKYEDLHKIIKSSFGSDIPLRDLENVRSVDSLMHLVKKYQGKNR